TPAPWHGTVEESEKGNGPPRAQEENTGLDARHAATDAVQAAESRSGSIRGDIFATVADVQFWAADVTLSGRQRPGARRPGRSAHVRAQALRRSGTPMP